MWDGGGDGVGPTRFAGWRGIPGGTVDIRDQGLQLELTGHEVRFSANQELCRNGLDFSAAVVLFRSKV
jgi:hypothetical protein